MFQTQRTRVSLDRGAALLLACLALLAAAPPALCDDAADPGLSAAEYRIGPKDLIEIKVFEVPDLNVELRVEENGAVRLPLLGDLQVRGLTASEVAERLRTVLEERYVQRASVSVEVREFRSRPISVIGAVKQPGPLALSGRWTLLEAIAAAGGLDDDHGDVVYVMRRSENGLTDQIKVDLHELMVAAAPEANIPVFAGDLINVPATIEVTVFCLGEVARPGALTFKSTERLTLLAAIARAGGLTDRASNSILIRRHDRNNENTEIEVNYKRIVAAKVPDPELQRDDVVVVKESFF